MVVIFKQTSEPFSTLMRMIALLLLSWRRKRQHITSSLVVTLLMVMLLLEDRMVKRREVEGAPLPWRDTDAQIENSAVTAWYLGLKRWRGVRVSHFIL